MKLVIDRNRRSYESLVSPYIIPHKPSSGGTEEISSDEYQAVAEKYAKMFR